MISFKQFLSEALDVTKNPKFRKWFRGSKVVDENKQPLVCYHGSGTAIEEFKYEFTNQGADQLGSGFYFTTDITEAEGYTGKTESTKGSKLGGSDNPTVHPVYLCIKKPLDADKIGNVKYDKINFFIKRSPELADALSNYGDVEWEGKEKVIRAATEIHVIENDNIVKGLFSLANDFYSDHPKEFNWKIYQALGYDGVFKKHPNGRTHWVAFFPFQIKHVDNRGMFDGESNNIFESIRSNETLVSFLNKEHPYVGVEKEEILSPTVKVLKDKYGSYRFLKYENEQHIAVIQVLSNKRGIGHVANIYTKPEYRRQGIMSELLQHVRDMFPKKLTFSEDRSEDGEAFVKFMTK